MENQENVVNIDSISTDLTKRIMQVNEIMKKLNGENQELRNIISILEKEVGNDRIKELFPKPEES